MSLQDEIAMLKNNIVVIKSKMAHAQTKRDYLLLKDQLHTTRMELVLAQAEAREGYSMSD